MCPTYLATQCLKHVNRPHSYLCSGQLETPDAGVTYVMDVLEEVGADVSRRCFWDFGDWSDLWRDTKHVPLDVTLQVGSFVVMLYTSCCQV
jgi:hypothetical protein